MASPHPDPLLATLDALSRRGEALRQRVDIPAFDSWKADVQAWIGRSVSEGEALKFGFLMDTPLGRGIPDVYDGLVLARLSFLGVLRQQLFPPREEPLVKLFISHSAADVALARTLVDFVRGCLDIPDTAIRCTSVPGFKLETGASASETLRAELRAAPCVIGLITPSSAAAAWVLFELGARWGQNLHVAPVLHPGADFALLPGPLRERHAVKLDDEPGMLQLVDELSERLPASKRKSPLVREAQFTLAAVLRGVPNGGPAAPEDPAGTYGVADIRGILAGWIKERPYGDAEKVIHLAQLDAELNLPPGSAKAHIESVASELGYPLAHKGDATIAFKQKPRALGRAYPRRDRMKGW